MTFRVFNADERSKEMTSLEKDLQTIYSDDTEFSSWNLNYFYGHTTRYERLLEIIDDTYSRGELLEIGSVPCHITYLLDRSGYEVTGVDIKPERASKFIEQTGLQVINSNIETEELPFADDRFQYVVFSEVFEHLRINPINALREIHRVLSPGGTLLMTTPNLYALRHRISILKGEGLYASPYEEFRKVEDIGHMGHVRVYSKGEIEEFLKKCGFAVDEIQFDNFEMGDHYGVLRPFSELCYRLWPSTRRFQVVIAHSA